MKKLAIVFWGFSLLTSPARACIAVIEMDRSETGWQPEIERADAIFSGTIRSIRDGRLEDEIGLLERLNCALPWKRCIYMESEDSKIAEIDVSYVQRGEVGLSVSVKFTEGLSHCEVGPYREALKISAGQTGVFFADSTSEGLAGWVPPMDAIEELDDPELRSAAIAMFRQFAPCEPDGSERHSLKIGGFPESRCLWPPQKAAAFKDQYE